MRGLLLISSLSYIHSSDRFKNNLKKREDLFVDQLLVIVIIEFSLAVEVDFLQYVMY